MKAKADGDSFTSDALKLVLLLRCNEEPVQRLIRSTKRERICVGGQLLITDLIDKLEDVKEFKPIQSNTDGIIIKYQKARN